VVLQAVPAAFLQGLCKLLSRFCSARNDQLYCVAGSHLEGRSCDCLFNTAEELCDTNVVSQVAGLAQSVSDYRLDDRAIGVRSWRGQRIFPLASESRPALGPTQPPVLSPGVKARPGLTTHPHLVPRSRMSRSYIPPLPPSASMACSGTASPLPF
jgi:hypothetical protein